MWLLVEQLDFLTVSEADLTRYLEEFSAGMLQSGFNGQNEATPLKFRTVLSARNVLIRMFRALCAAGVRADNPAASVVLPDSSVPSHADLHKTQLASEHWHEIQQSWAEQPDPEIGNRDPLYRMIAVAEWSYWTALHRSELAAAFMMDLQQMDDKWHIGIRRFGRSDRTDLIYVPPPAMEALRRYRISRGLSPLPDADENSIPLISQLRSESPVSPWAIGHILREATRLVDGDIRPPNEACALSNRALRRYLIADGLMMRIPYQDLAAHVRSHHALDNLIAGPATDSIQQSLAVLETGLHH
jgi:hypothetical protein